MYINTLKHYSILQILKFGAWCKDGVGSVFSLQSSNYHNVHINYMQYSVHTQHAVNIPHLFISRSIGRQCIPLGNAFLGNPYYQFYYWIFFIENYALPFVLLLTMNGVIIRTLSRRPILQSPVSESQGHGQGEGHKSKIKSSEKQIYIMLLVVTFGFLILITPAYIFFIYIWLVDYMKSGKSFALYYFLYHFGHKTYNTNYGINFYLYVISDKKFRNDLIQLFQKRKLLNHNFNSSSVISMNTINSSL